MASIRKAETISPQEYLAGEEYSDVRHEYVAGYIYAMTGASEAHNLIAGNLHAALHTHLRGNPCRVFVNDMKVRVSNDFYYPDLMVCCNPADNAPYYKTHPILLIEVLSPTTERADTLEKRIAYQTLESLYEYALVAQDKLEIRIYRRIDKGWELETLGAGDTMSFSSIALALPLEQVYEEIDLASSP